MNRREVNVSLEHEFNPGFEKVSEMLAEKFKVERDAIAVKKLKSHFGSNKFLVEALIYDSLAHKESIEPKPKAKKPKVA